MATPEGRRCLRRGRYGAEVNCGQGSGYLCYRHAVLRDTVPLFMGSSVLDSPRLCLDPACPFGLGLGRE